MGKTGEAIARAMVAGERDGAALAKLRDRRVKADEATLARSLRGNWREEHLFALEQAVERYDLHTGQIVRCEERIGEAVGRVTPRQVESRGKELVAPGRTMRERELQVALREAMGVDLTAIPTLGVETALTIAGEVGRDLSRFPTCGHFCSWLCLAPGMRISGGKSLRGRPARRFNRAGQALCQAAVTARRSHSFIGASHRARLRRLDCARAVKATAHQFARLVYAMLTRGEEYVERDIAEFEAERRGHQLHHLRRQARHFNLTLVPAEQVV